MNLTLLLTARDQGLTPAINRVNHAVNALGRGMHSAFSAGVDKMRQLNEQVNGFSLASKLAAAAGGMFAVKAAITKNLDFESTLLDMKQTAQMTVKQAAEMRALAINAATRSLALPTEIAAGLKAFAAAGLKFDQIAPSIEESARAAVAFRSTIEDMAKLDFDLLDKMGIKPERIKEVHNMLLYHAKSGRFEARPMAAEAPKYLNAAASVGIGGVEGLNFAGAMTQVLMKLAPATQPSEVSTFMEHGLGHITARQQVKGLGKFGIDVKKYMPDGKFYGTGGVDGILDLAKAMKAAGLDNPFKMDEAGFREMYTKKFWKQMMQYNDQIRQAMAEGAKAAADDMVGRDKAEIERSNFGKIKKAVIAKEKRELGDAATGATGIVANAAEWASENQGATAAIVGGAMVAGRLVYNRVKRGSGGSGGAIADAVGGALGGAKVFVTNWPASMGGSPIPGKGKFGPLGSAETVASTVAKGGVLAAAGAAGLVVGGGAGLMLGTGALLGSESGMRGQATAKAREMLRLEGRMREEQANAAPANVMARLEAQRNEARDDMKRLMVQLLEATNKPVEVIVDGQVIARAVNRANAQDAKRQ